MNLTYWKYHTDDNNVQWWTFATPNKSVNVLATQPLLELEQLIQQAANTMLAAVVIHSDKPGQFIAGADVSEIATINSVELAGEKARAGQRIFDQLAALNCPTVAVINGPGMGGGCELALACRYRVMTDHPKACLALPEVQLGFIPGWGGTVRLPRLVGFGHALTMMSSGKKIYAKPALKMGLIDQIISDTFVADAVAAFLARPPQRQPLPLSERLPGVGMAKRQLTAHIGKRMIRARTGGRMPAPPAVVNHMLATHGMGTKKALEREATTFARLAVSPESKSLVGLFNATNQAKSSVRGKHGIQRIAVIGAGVMGGGIAWLFASRGINVVLKDIACEALAQARKHAESLAKKAVKARALSKADAGLALDRITCTTESAPLAHCDAAVEAVVEKLAIKQQVVAELANMLPDHAPYLYEYQQPYFKDIGAQLTNDEQRSRLVGMHFFNPVHRMPLVEVVAGPCSDEAQVQRIGALCAACGKTPILVGDGAGFVVNRILLPCLNEAGFLLQQGCHPEHVDHVLKQFGLPMGHSACRMKLASM